MCLVFFFILARYTELDFLFRYLSAGRPFSKLHYSWTAGVFLTVYTIYAVNKIFWFSLRKNGYCSAIYGSIHRFLEAYVWCFYIGFIPICILGIFLGIWPFSDMPPYIHMALSWNLLSVTDSVFYLYCYFVIFSWCLLPLLLVQRFSIMCYRVANNKPIGKSEDDVRFWLSTKTSIPITFYTIVRHFALIIWEFFYWIAIPILLSSIPALVLVIHLFGSGTDGSGGAWFGILIAGAVTNLAIFLIVALCYLAFSIIMRRLFGVITLFIQRSLRRSTG